MIIIILAHINHFTREEGNKRQTTRVTGLKCHWHVDCVIVVRIVRGRIRAIDGDED